MRAFLSVTSLVAVALLSDTSDAQIDRKTKEGAAVAAQTSGLRRTGEETPEQIRQRGRQWFDQCMADWDAQTHMSKSEWERTCRRVALERTKFLMDEQKKK